MASSAHLGGSAPGSVAPVRIGPGDPQDAGVAELLRRSEEFARALYPPESVHILPAAELNSPVVRFLVARDAETDTPLGCGGMVLRPDASAEIKRMFVDAPARGRGIGTAILQNLERMARNEGVQILRLETGVRQAEALNLYRRQGYSERGPFGPYREDPLSVFMEKALD